MFDLLELDVQLEYFLVLDYNPIFDRILLNKIREINEFKNKVDINVKYPSDVMKNLNWSQQGSIDTILNNQFSGAIQGPPGTGKTEVLAKLVEIAVANDLKVGVLSYTNKAVDNALSRISKTIKDGVCRVGDPLKSDVANDVTLVKNFTTLNNYKVFGSTTHKILFAKRIPHVDVLFIDEASQIPSYFLPGIKNICCNIVMIGDQHQLPPILTVDISKEYEPDCFSLYRNEQKQLPMLNIQYRMNKTIQDWSSQRYYNGKLRPHYANTSRDIFLNTKSQFFGDKVINYDNGNGNIGREKILNQIVHYIKEAKHLTGISWDEIGIISPHRKHACQVNRKIQEVLGPKVNELIFADTVDRYQGREKEFIIFTLSNEMREPAEFLNDYRRINVAITRAKSRFYVVSDFMPEKDGEFSSFLNWCISKSDFLQADVA